MKYYHFQSSGHYLYNPEGYISFVMNYKHFAGLNIWKVKISLSNIKIEGMCSIIRMK